MFEVLRKGYFILPLASLIILCMSCSDITSISKEQLKKYSKNNNAQIIIGPGPITVSDPPLIIVNGKTVSDISLMNLNPQSINSISILKGKKAIKIYGKAAKGGVVIVSTDDSAKAKKDSVLAN